MNPSTPAPSSTSPQLTGSSYAGDTGFGGTNIPGVPQPSTLMDASQLGSQSPQIQFPDNQPSPQAGATNANNTNASIATPTSSAQTQASIVAAGSQPNAADQTNTGLLGKLADFVKGKQSLATIQSQQETAAGLPAKNDLVTGFSNQLEALTNQGLDLQNKASTGGQIQNQEQQNAQGRGITAGGLAPQTAADIRTNQIQQSTIASKALTLKSQLYAAQNDYANAKDAADKAAQVAFDSYQQNIDYTNALIAQNLPEMTRQDKAQALGVQAQLADYQQKIDEGKQAASLGQGLIASATQAYGNDPSAKYAIGQAMQIPLTDPNYSQKVFDLVGKYQKDPVAAATAYAQMQKAQADAKVAQQNVAQSSLTGDSSNLDPTSQSILSQTGLSVAAFNFLTTGTSALSRLSSTDRQKIMNEAGSFLNKNGLDYSTFQSQYKAQNDVVQQNVKRFANTDVAANELKGTLANLDTSSLNKQKLSSLNWSNVAQIWAGQQVNDAGATEYAGYLNSLGSELAYFNAAQQGKASPDLVDYNSAANLIKGGLAQGGITGLKTYIQNTTSKMTAVAKQGVDSANKSVWGLFGVGDKYKSTAPTQGTTGKLPNGTVVTKDQFGQITDAQGNVYDTGGRIVGHK